MFEKKLYIARRIKVEPNENGVDIEYFEEPKLYYFNYQPVSGYLGLQQYGEDIGNVYRMFVDRKIYQGKIKVGDRAYLSDGEITESDLEKLIQNEESFGDNANYKVELALPQNFKMQIDLIKIK